MSRDFARQFYHSKQWLTARDAYIRSVDGLCERCLALGRLTPGAIVHHKIPLTPQNIHNPHISLGFDNLELVCRDCHAKEHSILDGRAKQPEQRIVFDEDGNPVQVPTKPLI